MYSLLIFSSYFVLALSIIVKHDSSQPWLHAVPFYSQCYYRHICCLNKYLCVQGNSSVSERGLPLSNQDEIPFKHC